VAKPLHDRRAKPDAVVQLAPLPAPKKEAPRETVEQWMARTGNTPQVLPSAPSRSRSASSPSTTARRGRHESAPVPSPAAANEARREKTSCETYSAMPPKRSRGRRGKSSTFGARGGAATLESRMNQIDQHATLRAAHAAGARIQVWRPHPGLAPARLHREFRRRRVGDAGRHGAVHLPCPPTSSTSG